MSSALKKKDAAFWKHNIGGMMWSDVGRGRRPDRSSLLVKTD